MYLRITRLRFDPARYDEIVSFSQEIVTAIQGLPDCQGVEYATNPASGQAITISRWPTEEHATAAAPRERLAPLVARLQDAGLEFEPSEIYEIPSESHRVGKRS